MKRDTPDATEPSHPPTPWQPPWTARGVVDALGPLVLATRRERIQSVLASRLASVTVLMDAPHDPHNAAAILRSCDAFGVQHAHVVERDETFLAANKVAKGTERWVEVALHASPASALAALAASSFTLVATSPRGSLVPEDLAHIARVALVLGHEHDGIREELASAATTSVRIPMTGFVESLNVSVAAGILLGAATRGRSGDLGASERERLYAKGLWYTVPRAAEVLGALPAR